MLARQSLSCTKFAVLGLRGDLLLIRPLLADTWGMPDRKLKGHFQWFFLTAMTEADLCASYHFVKILGPVTEAGKTHMLFILQANFAEAVTARSMLTAHKS